MHSENICFAQRRWCKQAGSTPEKQPTRQQQRGAVRFRSLREYPPGRIRNAPCSRAWWQVALCGRRGEVVSARHAMRSRRAEVGGGKGCAAGRRQRGIRHHASGRRGGRYAPVAPAHAKCQRRSGTPKCRTGCPRQHPYHSAGTTALFDHRLSEQVGKRHHPPFARSWNHPAARSRQRGWVWCVCAGVVCGAGSACA